MIIKKKLRDVTPEEYNMWCYKNCNMSTTTCEKCVFEKAECLTCIPTCWVFNKDLYCNKFLNQTIEVEGPDILDEKEKEYLRAVIKPFRGRVTEITKKTTGDISAMYEFITIKYEDVVKTGYICLPYFKENFIYKGMVRYKKYTLEELGL